MTSWRCKRLRPRLVEFADGTLAEGRRARIERHLATCARCADTVVDLRELPAEIRRSARAQPTEEFWVRQRRAILGAIAERPVVIREAAPAGPRALLWGMPAALAAALALVLLVSRSPAPPAPAPPTGAATTARTAARLARDATPPRQAVSQEESMTWMDDPLFPEDTSLFGLAAELDENPEETSDNALI